MGNIWYVGRLWCQLLLLEDGYRKNPICLFYSAVVKSSLCHKDSIVTAAVFGVCVCVRVCVSLQWPVHCGFHLFIFEWTVVFVQEESEVSVVCVSLCPPLFDCVHLLSLCSSCLLSEVDKAKTFTLEKDWTLIDGVFVKVSPWPVQSVLFHFCCRFVSHVCSPVFFHHDNQLKLGWNEIWQGM